MAGVNVKMGVSGVAQFKRDIGAAEAAVKNLDKQLELNEQQFKNNGDQAMYMENKVGLLKAQIKKQEEVVRQCESALKNMRDNGVDPNSKAFQDMQGKTYGAATKLMQLKGELNGVKTGGEGAKKGLDKTDSALEKIQKNGAWANVTSGLKDLTGQLESAGRAAWNFGKRLYGHIEGSAEWADSLKTMAEEWEIGVEDLQRMQKVSAFIDTDVDAILTARQRMIKATTTKGGVKSIEEVLGLDLSNYEDPDDLMWGIGDALLHMDDAFDKENAAMAIFGRSWRDLLPMFKAGRDQYEGMLDDQKVMSEEDVNKLGEVDDKIKSIQQELELMKNQFIADNAETIKALLQWFLDNSQAIITAITLVGAALTALKIGEFATNVMKTVNGLKQLTGGGGTPSAPSAPSAPSGPSGGNGGGGGGWLRNLGKGALKVAPFAAPVALFVDGVIRDQQIVAAMLARGEQAQNDFTQKMASYSGSDMFGTWQSLRGMVYGTGNGAGDEAAARAFAEEWMSYVNDMDAENDQLLSLWESLDSSGALEQFNESMAALMNGEMAYSDEDAERIYGPINTALALVEAKIEEGNRNGLKPGDLIFFRGLPAAIQAAVQNGMSGATVVIDRNAVNAIGGIVGQNLWGQLMGQLQ